MAKEHKTPDSVNKALFGYLYKRGLRDFSKKILLESAWKTIVGPQLSKHSTPARIYKGTLTIETKHPSWNQELSYYNDFILKQINNYLHKHYPLYSGKDETTYINKIYFNVAKPKEKVIPYNAKYDLSDKTISNDAKAYINDNCRAIPDRDVAESFKSLMRKSYKRFEKLNNKT